MKPRAPKQPGEDWTRGPAAWLAGLVIVVAAAFGVRAGLDRLDPPPAMPPISGAAARGATMEASENPAPEVVSGIHPVAEAAPDAAGIAPAPGALVLIDLNSATAAELDLLPGIGPALAERILASRRELGPFRSVDDLDRVKGIGPRTIEKLRNHVMVGVTPAGAP